MSESTPIPMSHKVISILAILWNLFGVLSFLGHAFMQEQTNATLNDAQRAYMEGFPAWGYIVFGTAVTTGILGAIGLLMRKSWTPLVFTISLLAILVNQFYPIVATNYMEIFGSSSIFMPIIITAIGAALLFYSKQCDKKGWLS